MTAKPPQPALIDPVVVPPSPPPLSAPGYIPPEPPATGLSLADRLSLPRIHWAWLLLIAGFITLFWASRSVIGPFVAGFVVAYLLDPPAQKLEQRGWPRWLASVTVLVIFFVAIVGLLLASAPIVQAQVTQLIVSLPKLIDDTIPVAERLLRNTNLLSNSREIVANLGNRAIEWLTGSIGTIVAGSLALVNLISFVVITPIVAFYLLRDWPIILARIESWWPRPQLPAIKQLTAESDIALSGFIRGQSLVCIALALFYAVGWSILGLNYAIILGLLAGILGFVPFLGVIFAVGLSLLVGLGQWGFDWVNLGMLLVIFFVGQMLESSILTPNLIGNRIGLHPVWVLFAVFAGGTVAGIVGVFFAVPVAAVLGVIVRHALAHYRASHFYGPDPRL
ncbi:AI-2E family transporter [Polymorphobacter glacialis]|uniref:AI-2E family transporter n=1 Tax=Sandarakinorhabdus glacialis TaxID=1614636 RepID=A0A916ZNQ0_9SPHN|nr:AI-2E family transporter [Polymorphobacter glacialis]GGE06598.1 AI-2E family transporter [Polymorphobacter glacialis]